MTKSLYIASLEPNSGKLVATLGTMEILSRQVERLGFFRVIVPGSAEEDSHIRLLNSRFKLCLTPDEMVGVTHEQAKTWIAAGEEKRLLSEIVLRFKAAEAKCGFLLCEGPDITHLSEAFDYTISLRIAHELGCQTFYVSSEYRASTPEILENIKVAERNFKQLKWISWLSLSTVLPLIFLMMQKKNYNRPLAVR